MSKVQSDSDAHVDAAEADGSTPKAGPVCTLAPDCGPLRASGLNLEACCSKDIKCGLDLSPITQNASLGAPALRDLNLPFELDLTNPCVPPGAVYLTAPGFPEERIRGERNGDILTTPECDSRTLFGFVLAGCCMPSGQCGVSTHAAIENLRFFANPDAEIRQRQCASAVDFNRQMRDTSIAVMGALPDIQRSCDYAGLNKRLPSSPIDAMVK